MNESELVRRFTGLTVAFFDCFGTVFDMSDIPREEIAAYVEHVRREDFTPYEFPPSWYSLKAHPDAAEGIRHLRYNCGLRCVAFSNGSWELISEISKANSIRWSGITSPAACQAYKPHPKAYESAVRMMRVPAIQCLMVTANPTFGDIEGAAGAGMQSCVIRHGFPNNIIELAEVIDNES